MDAFIISNMAARVAGLVERQGYIKKEKGKWCVKSEKNPGWSGGCYTNKEDAEKRLGQVEMFKAMKK
jgi:hypothetical protein